ncbi:hypothetical protein PV773_01460 [Mesorhizobium sp. CC13]|uniref:hypothetical protein n=1 Tax=Mesorhizobium sp. CC13 TaxID=3029194 RepID=UPI0032664D45
MRDRRLARHGIAGVLFAALSFGMTAKAVAPALGTAPVVAADAGQFFVSGHSLTDRPFPDMLEAIAAASGRRLTWERQHIGGSSIRQRTLGPDGSPPGSGYGAGVGRDGKPIDVIAELAVRRYDVLIVTEWHRVLDAMLSEGTATYMGELQDRFMAGNPRGMSYFLAPWADLSDLTAPGDWIDYERAASPVWQCLVEGINRKLAGQDRQDRIRFIPASLALAELVARLTSAQPVAGFEGLAAEGVTAALFTDRVHLTELGNYFVAVAAYATVFGNEAATAPVPAALDQARAESLRSIALELVAQWRVRQAFGPDGGCEGVPARFVIAYTGYMERTYTRPERGYVVARAKRIRDTVRLIWSLRRGVPGLEPAEAG